MSLTRYGTYRPEETAPVARHDTKLVIGRDGRKAQRLARLQLLGDIEALINGTYGD